MQHLCAYVSYSIFSPLNLVVWQCGVCSYDLITWWFQRQQPRFCDKSSIWYCWGLPKMLFLILNSFHITFLNIFLNAVPVPCRPLSYLTLLQASKVFPYPELSVLMSLFPPHTFHSLSRFSFSSDGIIVFILVQEHRRISDPSVCLGLSNMTEFRQQALCNYRCCHSVCAASWCKLISPLSWFHSVGVKWGENPCFETRKSDKTLWALSGMVLKICQIKHTDPSPVVTRCVCWHQNVT